MNKSRSLITRQTKQALRLRAVKFSLLTTPPHLNLPLGFFFPCNSFRTSIGFVISIRLPKTVRVYKTNCINVLLRQSAVQRCLIHSLTSVTINDASQFNSRRDLLFTTQNCLLIHDCLVGALLLVKHSRQIVLHSISWRVLPRL